MSALTNFSRLPAICRPMAAVVCLLVALPAIANIPGGGTNGPDVTLTDNGTTVTLANGIVSILCVKAGATINQINYSYNNGSGAQTNQLLAGGHNGGQLYWETGGFGTGTFSNSVVADPANNGGNYAEISLLSMSTTNGAMEIHFSMLRGSPGFYVTAIWSHRSADVAMTMGETRDNIYAGSIFNWMSVDGTRNRLMEVQSNAGAIPVLGAPAEVTLWTNGIYAGRYEDKYKYSADFGAQRVWGWSSVGVGGYNVGLWNVSASVEYYNGGPLKRELMEHIGTTILNMTRGSHYGGGTDSSWATGEIWTHVYGPYFIYCNNITNTITDTNQAAQALYSDALAQATAEATAWPYSWFTNANYAPAANRGTVTGQMVINDSYNPNASAAGLWVGVVQQPATSTATYDFQIWQKPYQFWVKTDTNGDFTIPNVIVGANYTLYAFGPGAAGTFQSQAQTGGVAPNTVDIPVSPFSVTVTGGATNDLGAITWTPTRVGPTVFEIGYPDRTAAKFRHGEDWWVGGIGPSPAYPSPIWTKFLEYPFDFPIGPNYTVGQSRWTTDWNFVQPCVVDDRGFYNDSSSTITFNLPSAPSGTGSFYLALSSAFQVAVEIAVNGTQIAGSSGYNPAYSSSANQSDTTIREGIHGLFSDNRINFSASLLHAGANTITVGMRQTGKVNGNGYFADHAMYDYLRLELAGYVPPPPASATAYAGNTCNLICWPVTPGATSYNILRSTTSGSGYLSITNGVAGPVSGSGWNNATFLDTGAVNGTTYYYVVQSVNPVGASTNSPESSGATPDAGISSSPPAPPTGLAVGSAGHQSVTLNWSTSPGANFYTVYRSTLFDNGGGASNVLGTVVLANNVTGTSYTDTSPTDGSIYSYFVTASSAGGTGSSSSSAVAVPLPAPPAGAPGSLTATPSSVSNIILSWLPVSGAVGYVVQRSTGLSGTYVLLNSVTETNYTDFGLNTNVTYYYKVTPVNAGGIGVSGLTTTKPAAPAGLTALAGNTEIFLIWPASVGATGYVVMRGTSSGNETTTVVSGLTGTNYTDTGLVNGTTSYYVVSASGSAANSANSPEASATPGTVAPPTISKITISSGYFSLHGSGGFPTATYHVLAATNLTLPAAQWTPVVTDQFDTGGNFVVTNGINPAWPQTFYRIQSQ
jgi:rhamnogalacturonan endolyase